MKIIKKLFASVLSVSILSLSCMVPCAFASQPTPNVDDFEDEAIRSGFSKFPNSGFTKDPQDSDVFVEDTSDSFSSGLDIVGDTQVDSTTGKVMQASNRSASSGNLYSKKVRLKLGYNGTSVIKNADGALRISYNFRFTSFAQNIEGSDATYFYMMRNGAGGFGLQNGESDKLVSLSDTTKGFKPEINRWYTLVSTVTSDKKLCSYILDADTNEVLLTSGTHGYSYNTYSFYPVCFEPVTSAEGTTTAQIDNVKILHYLPAEYAPAVISSSIENNATEVAEDTTTLTVEFDQPLKTLSAKVNGVDSHMTAVSNKLNTYEIALPELEGGTTYTVDFTGSKNEKNVASADAITFTTAGEAGGNEPEEPETPVEPIEQGIVKVTDDFEDSDLLNNGYDGYNHSIKNNEGYIKDDSKPLIAKRGGYKQQFVYLEEGYTNNALVFETDGARVNCFNALATHAGYTPETKDEDNEQFVLTYRMNIKQAGAFNELVDRTTTDSDKKRTAKGTAIRIGVPSKTDLMESDSIALITNYATEGALTEKLGIHSPGVENSEFAPVETDHWYNITWVVDKNTQKFYFTDAETGKLVWQTEQTVERFTTGEEAINFHIFRGERWEDGEDIFNHEQIVMIDDFTLYRIKPWVENSALTAEVTAENGVVSMAFNQPVIPSAEMFDLYKTSDEDENDLLENVTPVFGTDLSEVSVGFDGVRYLTDYTLDYSQVTSVAGIGFGENTQNRVYAFTSGKDALGLTLVGDISYTSLTSGSEVTAILQKDTTGNADLIIAFYSGKTLLGTAFAKGEAFASDIEKEVTFTLASDMSGADTIKVFAFNSLSGLVPAMTAYTK